MLHKLCNNNCILYIVYYSFFSKKTYCGLLTKGQLRLLTAIAKEQKIVSYMGSEFIKKYNLTSASSEKLAMKALVDKSLILKDESGRYFVYDRFFSLWLQRTTAN